MRRGGYLLLGLVGLAQLLSAPFARPQRDRAHEPTVERIVVARLVYAGNRTAQCFSGRFLERLNADTRLRAEPELRRVKLDSPELFAYPFAILSGEGEFTLSDRERAQLRRYVTRGGFLVASAGCSNAPWARSFRAEFARMFPGQTLQTLPRDHPLFRTVYRLERLQTSDLRKADREARLEALTLNGRIALLFSPDGLNNTENAINCCCCGGDEIEQADYLAANLLAYALLH